MAVGEDLMFLFLRGAAALPVTRRLVGQEGDDWDLVSQGRPEEDFWPSLEQSRAAAKEASWATPEMRVFLGFLGFSSVAGFGSTYAVFGLNRNFEIYSRSGTPDLGVIGVWLLLFGCQSTGEVRQSGGKRLSFSV